LKLELELDNRFTCSRNLMQLY